MAKFTIKLGEKEWDIDSPLKFKQLRVIEPAMSKIIAMRGAAEGGNTEKFYEEMATVIIAAVNNKGFDKAQLDELPVKVSDLIAAVQTIAQAAGMWKAPEDGATASPKAPSPSNGGLSMQSLDIP